ncbi:MAG: FAD-binding oxidoreductase [candidate division WOR-3 bacterium]|nr:FAD-binding oxidoreductase [candidate division WOR-3 bacterium]
MMWHLVKIINKEWLSRDIFSMEFTLHGLKPAPGQFFQIRINESYDPLLSRPISIADYEKGRLLMIVKIVGRGTEILSKKKTGDEVLIFGPLGKKLKIKNKKSLIIAGGIGVAPLYFLAKSLKKARIDFTFVYGARTPSELVLKDEIKKLSSRAVFITETGSNKAGTALSVLNELNLAEYGAGYACGPRAMLVELKKMNLQFPVYAFCEDFLGCGCGLCLGCAIKYKGSYKRICEDGPVFELKGLEFND